MSTPPSTPPVADLDPVRARSRVAPDARPGRSADPLRRGCADLLRGLDDDELVEAGAPYLWRRIGALMASLAPSTGRVARIGDSITMTTGAGVGSGPGDEPAPPRALDDAQPPSAPVVPVPDEAAAVSPGSPAAASSSQGNAGAAAKAAIGARRREQIRAFVVAHGPVSSTQVAEHLGGGHTTAAEHLRALAVEGAIARGTNGGAPWSTRYAATQGQADAAARAARPGNRTLAEARSNLAGQGADAPEDGATTPLPDDERRPLGASTVPLAAVDALPPTVSDAAPAGERRRPLERLLADEAAAEHDARARAASDAARRALLARAVPPPPPGRSGGRLAEPPPRPRNA